MTLDPIARAKQSISAFTNATSFNMTSIPRRRVGELLTFLNKKIVNEPPNIEFLNCIHQLQTVYDTNFSDEAFNKLYDTLPINIDITIPKGQETLEKSREIILKNLKYINQDDWHLTKLDVQHHDNNVKQIKTTASTRIRYSSTDLNELILRTKQFNIPGHEYNFNQSNDEPTLNQELGGVINHILYQIRLHLHCIELFDHHGKYKKLQKTLELAIENYVAPLVCPDIYYHDDFVAAFKKELPTTWKKTLTSKAENCDIEAAVYGKEAAYYSDFAFQSSGTSDPQAKTKIINRKNRKSNKS